MGEFMCRDCYTYVAWMTAKSGKTYLAEALDWVGDQYGAQRTYWPAHRCAPNPQRQAEYLEEQEAKATARAEREATEAAREAARQAGVTVPTGRTTVTGTVLKVKGQETYYTYSGGFTLKMLVETAEGWRVWGTVPTCLWDTLEEGDAVTFTATLEVSKDDTLFGFFKRPTKAKVLEAAQ